MSDKKPRQEFKRTPVLTIVKYVSFAVLSIISISLSVYLFLQFSPDPVESVLFGALAIAFEGTKLYALVDGHKEWANKRFLPAVTKISMYVILAFLSVVASYGFSLGALQRAELDPETTAANQKEERIERQIDDLTEQIQVNVERYEELPADWVTASEQYVNRAEELREERRELEEELDEIEPQEFDVASNMFVMIGASIGMEGDEVMFYLLIILAVAIELNIIFTSPDIRPVHKPHKDTPLPPKPDPPPPPPEKKIIKTKAKSTITKRPTVGASSFSKKKEPPKPKTPEVVSYAAPPKQSPKQEKKLTTNQEVFNKVIGEIVEAFFDNGENTYLKSFDEVLEEFTEHPKALRLLHISSEEGVKRFIQKVWDAMRNIKGPTGYYIAEYDKEHDVYTPNYTSELAHRLLIRKMKLSSNSK